MMEEKKGQIFWTNEAGVWGKEGGDPSLKQQRRKGGGVRTWQYIPGLPTWARELGTSCQAGVGTGGKICKLLPVSPLRGNAGQRNGRRRLRPNSGSRQQLIRGLSKEDTGTLS